MLEFSLDNKQKQTLEKYGEDFKKWIKTPDGEKTVREHRNNELYFKQKLSRDRIDRMSEEEFTEMYQKLWASNIWENKDWYVKNMLINKNGLDNIKIQF